MDKILPYLQTSVKIQLNMSWLQFVRFIHGGVFKEGSVGFVETRDLSARGISQKILNVLKPLEPDPALCVRFYFDEASVMFRHRGAVRVFPRAKFP